MGVRQPGHHHVDEDDHGVGVGQSHEEVGDARDEAQRIIDRANTDRQDVIDAIRKLQDDREDAREEYADLPASSGPCGRQAARNKLIDLFELEVVGVAEAGEILLVGRGNRGVIDAIRKLQDDREDAREEYADLLKDIISDASRKLAGGPRRGRPEWSRWRSRWPWRESRRPSAGG